MMLHLQARSIANDAVLVDVQQFIAVYDGASPARCAYDRWPKRIVALRTVENRFGSWSQAVALAHGRKT
jgi:hypothetical protein